MNDTSNDYYYAHDHLYSTAALTDSAGDVIERYEYDAYGNVHIMDGNYNSRSSTLYDNPYTFTGRRLDTLDSGNLNIMYYRHRYYYPELGRFLQHDPLGVNLMNFRDFKISFKAQYLDGLNMYGYTGSNPIDKIDPMGYYTEETDLVEQKCFKMPQFGDCAEKAKQKFDRCIKEAGERHDALVQAAKDACYSVCTDRNDVWRRLCERGCDYSVGLLVRATLLPEYLAELASCTAIYGVKIKICDYKYTYTSYCGPLDEDDFCVNPTGG